MFYGAQIVFHMKTCFFRNETTGNRIYFRLLSQLDFRTDPISRVKLGRAAGHRYHTAGQVAFRTHRARGEAVVAFALFGQAILCFQTVSRPLLP